jgi:hypothetical protein
MTAVKFLISDPLCFTISTFLLDGQAVWGDGSASPSVRILDRLPLFPIWARFGSGDRGYLIDQRLGQDKIPTSIIFLHGSIYGCEYGAAL